MTTHAAPGPPALSVGGVIATLAEAAVVGLAVAYVVSRAVGVLLAWEGAAVLYLAGGLLVALRQASRRSTADRTGVFGALSWVLPLASSLVGVYSAVLALIAQSSASKGQADGVVLVLASVVAILLSWLLLQVGMAQSYQALRSVPDTPAFDFPETPTPVLLDFLYFAFAVGAAFATSDTRVLSRRVRLLVLVHSAVSFFYNAFVIAVAFQALQAVIPSAG